ncbi:MAG: MFS transporter [Novosphingobium sp.]|jgi:MFS family permease|nr:MFS transporter [Novosphingobium sp.]
MGDGTAPRAAREDGQVEPYAWYMLGVLVLVYVFNFVDRQLLAILAPALKRNLGISDSDFGFLYGTAFGVFYALFGIPLGKLADRWVRVRLLATGLAIWSLMTALSGFSRNFGQLAVARVGVGVGEATLTPCTYSLLSDFFPPHRRATAIGLYSTGLYIGSGLSLFLGSSIAGNWDRAYGTAAPLGLAGWQAAFLLMGIPGLLLSLWVASLREPVRGRFDPAPAAPMADAPADSVMRGFIRDVADIVPPFTLIGAARRGAAALAANLLAGTLTALAAAALIAWLGDPAQWIAFGLGSYAVISWLLALRAREPASFAALFHSAAFIGLTLGYTLLSIVGYANLAFAPLYAIQELHANPAAAGFMLGGIGALGGSLGVVLGGIAADRAARDGVHARRVVLIGMTVAATMLLHGVMFTATTLTFYYPAVFVTMAFMSASLGGASGTLVNIVPPHLRATATAAFLLSTNMLGLALGPYAAGKLSTVTGSLGTGLLALLVLAPPSLIALALAYRALPKRAGQEHRA